MGKERKVRDCKSLQKLETLGPREQIFKYSHNIRKNKKTKQTKNSYKMLYILQCQRMTKSQQHYLVIRCGVPDDRHESLDQR